MFPRKQFLRSSCNIFHRSLHESLFKPFYFPIRYTSDTTSPKILSKSVLIIGGRGTVGSGITTALKDLKLAAYDEINLDITIGGSSNQGDSVSINNTNYTYTQIDLTDSNSIKSNLTNKQYDWIVACGGSSPVGFISDHTLESYRNGFNSKAFGQIDLVFQGNKLLNDNGCIVLTSGYLDIFATSGVSGLATVDGMINAFTKSAGIEMERGIKLNCVSPGLLTQSKTKYEKYLPAQPTVDGKDVALAYVRALVSNKTGCVLEIFSPYQWGESS